MSNHANISAALLAAFNLDTDKADPVAIADALATVMVNFADLMRGPAPTPYFVGEELKFAAATELVADETPALILAELRKQTTLLEVLAKQGENAARMARVLCGDASGLPG